MNQQKKIFLLVFFSILSLKVIAQDISFTLSESTLTATNGELVSFAMQIENNTASSQQLVPNFVYDESDVRIVNQYPEGVKLDAGKKRFLPIKAIVSASAKSKEDSYITVQLLTSEGVLLKEEQLFLKIEQKRLVKMQVMKQNLIFENEGDTLLVPVKLENLGNTFETISLVTRFFNKSDNKSFERQDIPLQSFTDTIVYIRKLVDKQTLREDSFRITIKGFYSSGNAFGTGYLTANSVKNRRRHRKEADDLMLNAFQQNNQVRLSMQKNRDENQYFFFANNEVDFKGGTFQSNIDVNYFERNDLYNFRNTWIQYETSRYGVRAGNINNSDILNLIGRGGQAFYQADSARIEGGAIHKSYNLVNSQGFVYGKAAWAKYIHKEGWMNGGYEASLIYDDDPNSKNRNYIATGRSSIINRENIRLRAGASLSNNLLLVDETLSKIGGAAEVNLFAKHQDFTITSNNYWSSGYFSGLRKGALNLIERVSYTTGKYNFWASANILQFSPRYLSTSQTSINEFTTQRYDIGASLQLKNFGVTASPFYYTESRTNPGLLASHLDKLRMNSKDISTSINYSTITSRHRFSLNVIGGFFETNFTTGNKLHYRTMFNYSFKSFRLNALYQHNQFSIGEVLSVSQNPTRGAYNAYNIVPYYQTTFFDEKLQIQAGFTYSGGANRDPFTQFNGRADLHLPANFSVFFSTFYSDFSSNYYESGTLQFGVIKRFSKISAKEKRYNLRVYVYRIVETETGKQREPAAGELLFVGNEAFRTDDKGMIEYKKLPQGYYGIRVLNKKDWFAKDRKIDFIDDMDVVIEMNKTVPVIGKVTYEFTEFSYEIPKELYGLPIILTDSEGNTFTTRTDARGNFRTYVPQGNYVIQLDKPGYLDVVDVPNNNQLIEAKTGKDVKVNFTLKIRERRIERKKF